jgi:hypothetical protein
VESRWRGVVFEWRSVLGGDADVPNRTATSAANAVDGFIERRKEVAGQVRVEEFVRRFFLLLSAMPRVGFPFEGKWICFFLYQLYSSTPVLPVLSIRLGDSHRAPPASSAPSS